MDFKSVTILDVTYSQANRLTVHTFLPHTFHSIIFYNLIFLNKETLFNVKNSQNGVSRLVSSICKKILRCIMSIRV